MIAFSSYGHQSAPRPVTVSKPGSPGKFISRPALRETSRAAKVGLCSRDLLQIYLRRKKQVGAICGRTRMMPEI